RCRPPGRRGPRGRGARAGVAAQDPLHLAPADRGRGPLVRRPPRRARRRGAADRRRARRTGGAPPARCRPRTARAGGPARGAGRCLPRPHPSRPRRGRLMDTTLPLPAPLRACMVETRCELMRMWREPAYSIPVLGFPAMFYLLFAVLLNRGNPAAADYLLATYGVFGVVGAALFGFGVTIAMDRERGYLRLRRVLPAAPGAMLLARMAMAMLDRKSTRLNSSHVKIAYAVFCLKKKKRCIQLLYNS